MNYKTIQEIAIKWNMQPKEIAFLCRTNRINGAKKEGKFWVIPENASRPIDGRKRIDTTERLPLPIGVDQYKEMVSRYYYVDKTLMIKDILDSQVKVSLFTRPRRFGKSLNMDMIKTYFEKTEEDTSIYFKDKAIWQEGEKYTSHQGQYPVISLSFKDIRGLRWEDDCIYIKEIISEEYHNHLEIIKDSKLEAADVSYFNNMLNGTEPITEYSNAIRRLSNMLSDYYNHDVIIIIDEYDTPIQNSYYRGYYDEMITFMRKLFSSSFKGNAHLAYGILTGVLRVAKESLFSGLNNIREYTILDDKFSQYFGFTHKEVKAMLNYYHMSLHYKEVCEWYDGYTFGHQEIFNPWSVINCIYDYGIPKAYWSNTSSNDVIKQMVRESDSTIREKLLTLMKGESIAINNDLSLVYLELDHKPEAIFTLLLTAGYLKITHTDDDDNSYSCNVVIPNFEVKEVYARAILGELGIAHLEPLSYNIRKAIINNDTQALTHFIGEYLKSSISFFDTTHEDFYHGLLLGLYACMTNDYYIYSNREAGEGRYDISLEPKIKDRCGMIIELKVLKDPKNNINEELEQLSQTALKQINDRDYARDLKDRNIHPIIALGVAFYKKDACINSILLD